MVPGILQIMASNITKAEQRARERLKAGKAPLATHERLTLLEALYDALLFSWLENAEDGFVKGSAALSYQLERTRLEMQGLTRDHTLIDKREDPWNYTDYPLDGMAPEASDTVN